MILVYVTGLPFKSPTWPQTLDCIIRIAQKKVMILMIKKLNYGLEQQEQTQIHFRV